MDLLINIEDTPQLINYLRKSGRIEKHVNANVTNLAGGVSNRTILVALDNGVSWVMKQALNKLRVDGDWFCPPERIHFEADAMRWLDQNIPGTSPKLIFEDENQHLLAMEAVKTPFENLKSLLLDQPQATYFEAAGNLLGQIHQNGLNEAQIPNRLFDTHFFDILRVDPYYLETINQEKVTEKFYQLLIADTSRDRYTFTHGDYSPKNLLLKDHRLILLDHEVAHFGDGTFDLGFFIAHLLSKANHLRKYSADFLNGIRLFIKAYQSKVTHLDKVREQRVVRHAIGCLLARVCGLSQLEYLSEDHRKIQKTIGIALIEDIPSTVESLVIKFNKLLNANN